MGKVINLGRVRKRKERAAAAQHAAENRARFGRTPAQKERDRLEVEAAQQRMDLLKREE
ncbi:MAG TPA: DUF4169 family protein [Candidatus Binatia bacterium]|nr:DUF4169 family protein [Candidatus Binatia bacterium]